MVGKQGKLSIELLNDFVFDNYCDRERKLDYYDGMRIPVSIGDMFIDITVPSNP